MPVHPAVRPVALLAATLAAVLLAACSTGAAAPPPRAAAPDVDPSSDTRSAEEPAPAPPGPSRPDERSPHEVSLVADFGPLPDGTGNAVVETTWTVDAEGTRRMVVDTPAGHAAHHVITDDEHWWWLDPAVRETVADAEWIHFDLRAIEAAGGALPDLVAEARVPVPGPGEIHVGQIVAGHEVLAVEPVDDGEVHLTVAGIERPVVHRRRTLPVGTVIELPRDAVDVADLPDVLRW